MHSQLHSQSNCSFKLVVLMLALISSLNSAPSWLVQAQQQDVASEPFALVLLSSMNDTLNGTVLTSCHEGAAVEGLCPTYLSIEKYTSNSTLLSRLPTFTFNTSAPLSDNRSPSSSPPSSYQDQEDSPPPSGLVIFLLQGSNFNLSSPLSLNYQAATNVAIPLFTPDTNTADQFVFDSQNHLAIPSYIDDSVRPIAINQQPPRLLQRWRICETYYGYRYTTLAWVLGAGEAQNPSCEEVQVMRVFV